MKKIIRRNCSLVLYISLGILSILLYGCREEPEIAYTVSVVNNTDYPIYIVKATNSSDNLSFGLIKPSNTLVAYGSRKLERINPHSALKYDITKSSLVGERLERRLFQFLIFKESTLQKYDMKEIILNDIFDKRYVFTYPEFNEMNFCVEYNGDE